MSPLRGRRPLLALTVGAVAVVAVGGVAWAAIPDLGGVIHGCYQTKNGQLRVIDTGAGQRCNPNEEALQWNQTGPQGPQGVPGPQGAPGPQGLIEHAGVECSNGKEPLGGGYDADSTPSVDQPFLITESRSVLSDPVRGGFTGWMIVTKNTTGVYLHFTTWVTCAVTG